MNNNNLLKQKNATKHDWPSDWDGENGNYESVCTICGARFVGDKRRITCRHCNRIKPMASETFWAIIMVLIMFSPILFFWIMK